ncbi:hypothetical protein BHE74_00033380 [Ensete ventricosum]|nr:hypothetical protein BHE74_00033380 [Ensete ventricosum]RZS17187.1 hypothetical protein BHM03_00049301 [Ensete ventricosum]
MHASAIANLTGDGALRLRVWAGWAVYDERRVGGRRPLRPETVHMALGSRMESATWGEILTLLLHGGVRMRVRIEA